MDVIERIAETLLYEGYVLWPYRRSALKNRQRWTFGGVYPEAFSRAGGGTDRSALQTECLVEADAGATLAVSVRFLHVVARHLTRADGTPVDELRAGDARYLAWDEAIERRFETSPIALADGGTAVVVPIGIPAAETTEPIVDGAGTRVGAIIRSWQMLDAVLDVRVERLAVPGPSDGARRTLFRVTARIVNRSGYGATDRDGAIRRTLVSTHTILHATRAAFVSLLDPPDELRAAAAACRNEGTWPVLVGEDGARHTMLSSPIVLYDYPRVAPESPGDLFDGGEIDQLLVLNVLGLTDEEKDEMAATDPRTREILARTGALDGDQLARLHGAIRSLRPVER